MRGLPQRPSGRSGINLPRLRFSAAPVSDVAAVLQELGLFDAVYPILEGEYLTNLEDLRELSKSELREIGLTMGQAVKILRRIGG